MFSARAQPRLWWPWHLGRAHLLRVEQLPQRANHHDRAGPFGIRAHVRRMGRRSGKNLRDEAHPHRRWLQHDSRRKHFRREPSPDLRRGDRDRGNIGCAIVLPDKIEEFATETATLPELTQTELVTPNDEGLPPVANLLVVTPAGAGKPFLYYLGAGWSQSGEFATGTEWE